MFKLFNSLSGKKEIFKPLENGLVKMYVCGITPYDTTHLGHAFTYVFFDVLYRYLNYLGYQVNYTQNVTDIDDDLLKRARETRTDWQELGNMWVKRFLTDMKNLNVLLPTNYVRATDSISEILKINKELVKKSYAYEKDDNVYFEVNKFSAYGKLSKYPREKMIALLSQRGGDPADPKKRGPLDFILWQKSQKDEPGWRSPWGRGRPGWHIECSAMARQYLGERIDIHGGGHDLIYPHHESEIAQSESYTGKKPFVKYWLHTAMLYYDGQKMSKSLGNLVLLADLIKKYSVVTIRLLLLSHHYREIWEYKEKELVRLQDQAAKILNLKKEKLDSNKQPIDEPYFREFISYLNDDMDTPRALNLIYKLLNNTGSKHTSTLLSLLQILGFRV